MKIAMILVLLLSASVVSAQSLVGRWQLVKESTCIDEDVNADSEDEEALVRDMKSMSGPGTMMIEFKANNSVTESTKIISRKKSYNSNALLYKYTGEALHFLDKRSRMIIESFTVEQLSTDSLIISNASRACETRIFVKIK